MRVLVAAILTLSVAQLLDLATFTLMIRQVGSAAEANPLVAGLYAAYGMPIVAVAKVALVALTTAIVALLARAPASAHMARLAIVLILLFGIGAGLLGGVTNTAAIGLL